MPEFNPAAIEEKQKPSDRIPTKDAGDATAAIHGDSYRGLTGSARDNNTGTVISLQSNPDRVTTITVQTDSGKTYSGRQALNPQSQQWEFKSDDGSFRAAFVKQSQSDGTTVNALQPVDSKGRPTGEPSKFEAATGRPPEGKSAEQHLSTGTFKSDAGKDSNQGPPSREGRDAAAKEQAGKDAAKDSAAKDGAGKDGAHKDGASKDGASKDVANKDAAGKDGVPKDGAKDAAVKEQVDKALGDANKGQKPQADQLSSRTVDGALVAKLNFSKFFDGNGGPNDPIKGLLDAIGKGTFGDGKFQPDAEGRGGLRGMLAQFRSEDMKGFQTWLTDKVNAGPDAQVKFPFDKFDGAAQKLIAGLLDKAFGKMDTLGNEKLPARDQSESALIAAGKVLNANSDASSMRSLGQTNEVKAFIPSEALNTIRQERVPQIDTNTVRTAGDRSTAETKTSDGGKTAQGPQDRMPTDRDIKSEPPEGKTKAPTEFTQGNPEGKTLAPADKDADNPAGKPKPEEKDSEEGKEQNDGAKLLNVQQNKYVVRKGDTVLSIASNVLKQATMADCLYHWNKGRIFVAQLEGEIFTIAIEGSELIMPTKMMIETFKKSLQTYRGINFDKHFINNKDELAAIYGAAWRQTLAAPPTAIRTESTAAPQAQQEPSERTKRVASMLGETLPDKSGRVVYFSRFGDTFKSIALKHGSLNNVKLSTLLAHLNSTDINASLQRGTRLFFPTPEEIAHFLQDSTLPPPYKGADEFDEAIPAVEVVEMDFTPGGGTAKNASIKAAAPAETPEQTQARIARARSIPAPPQHPLPTSQLNEMNIGADEAVNPWKPEAVTALSEMARKVEMNVNRGDEVGLRISLEMKNKDKWFTIYDYEIFADSFCSYRYKRTGGRERQPQRMLPPDQARQLARNHFLKAWQNIFREFFARET